MVTTRVQNREIPEPKNPGFPGSLIVVKEPVFNEKEPGYTVFSGNNESC